MVTRHMKLDAAQTMKLIEVDKDGNGLIQHYSDLEDDLLGDAERYKVSLEQEAAQQAIDAISAPTATSTDLDDNRATTILNSIPRLALSQPLKDIPQPLDKKKKKTARKANAPQITVSALRRHQERLAAAMESEPTASASMTQKVTGDEGKEAANSKEKGKKPAEQAKLPKKEGQSKSAKRRAAKNRTEIGRAHV